MNLTLIALAAGGLALHFLGRYSEFWKTGEKIGPVTYVMQDPAGWLSALVGTVVCMLLLPEIPSLLGIQGFENSGLMKLAALTSGYMGSSLAAKLPALFTGRGVR